uniref:Arginyl-tRNA--protein transferase 1 n=1 Tax=Dendroctonus ponderosae TaxID=77166 RepID=A0AAR5PJA0_DENPD
MSVDLSAKSLAQWFSDPEQHKCGYCKSSSGSMSFGMLTEELTVEDYKDLIDRGWRRSGKYCYKPIMNETCCPQYAIRCDTTQFTLNKSHKKIMKKFNKFLNDGVFNKNTYTHQQDESTIQMPGFNKVSTIIDLYQEITTEEGNLNNITYNEVKDTDGDKHLAQTSIDNGTKKSNAFADSINTSSLPIYNKKGLKEGTGADPTRPPCKKAKLLRLEKKKDKLSLKGEQLPLAPKSNGTEKSLRQFLEDVQPSFKHKLKLKLISTTRGEEWKQVKDVEFELYFKYQSIVHNDPPERWTVRNFERFLVSSPLKLVLERMDVSHETFRESSDLFKKYQMAVHNERPDDCDDDSFYEFLVSTPLKHKPFPNGIDGPGYGSFHQQYWIDDKLIAVGVIDILPGCLSSVYFFYDPDYRDLTLGTYGSLREIQLVLDLQNKIPNFKYYYMGFYIHSCPKMRYKGKLNPSYLLCPETYTWFKIDKCVPKLDISKYSRLNEDSRVVDTNSGTVDEVNKIMVVYGHKLMYMRDFLRVCEDQKDGFNNLVKQVGKKSALNIVFWVCSS